MERFWNLVYYFVYRADYKLYLLFTKINPFTLIHKLPFQRRLYKRKGIDVRKEINEAFKRPDIGISSIRAGGFMGILVFLVCFGIVNVLFGLLQVKVILTLSYFIIFIIVSLAVNYFLFYKRDKYLNYFKVFDKMPPEEKKKWGWLSLGAIISILLFFIGSFFI